MPSAARRTCEYPGCALGPPDPDNEGQRLPYITHEENTKKEEVAEDINRHIKMAHELPLQSSQIQLQRQQNETQQIVARTKETEAETRRIVVERGTDVESEPGDVRNERPFQQKRDSIPRPSIQENSSESDFSFFTAQWVRYVKGSNMTEDQQLQQLWAACAQSLQRQLHNGGSGKLTTTTQLMASIKRLAVNRRNNLVNVVEFQRMGQNKEETIMAYSTRLNGQADICDMFLPCPGCSQDVSYKEHMLTYQFIRGLNDTTVQEKIMEAAAQAEGQQLTIVKALKIAEAYEMGKTSSHLVNSGGQLNRLSQHQANKNSSRQTSRAQKLDKSSSSAPCGNCGKTGHTSKLNDRRENCKAFDKTCSKCNLNGHYTSMCRGGTRATRDKSITKNKTKDNKDKPNVNEVKEASTPTEETAELGTLSGDWFLLNALQPTVECDIYEDSRESSSVLRQDKVNCPTGSLGALSKKDIKKLRHHVMDRFGNWTPANVLPHGRLQLQVSVSASAQQQFNLPVSATSSTSVSALADTGAQMCVADWQVAKRMGLSKSDLIAPALSVSVADNSNLELIGAHFVTLSSSTGQSSEQLVYFATGIGEFYLSKAALIDLQVIHANFPMAGSCKGYDENQGRQSVAAIKEVQGEFSSGLRRAIGP